MAPTPGSVTILHTPERPAEHLRIPLSDDTSHIGNRALVGRSSDIVVMRGDSSRPEETTREIVDAFGRPKTPAAPAEVAPAPVPALVSVPAPAPARIDTVPVVQPPAPAVVNPPERPRKTVVIGSPTMGRHRLKVANLAISQTMIGLFYYNGDDDVVVEPPYTPPGSDAPIFVEVDGRSYKCWYLGFSVEVDMGHQLLLVVLVRDTE